MKSNNLPQNLRMQLIKKLGKERLVKFFEFWLGRCMTPVKDYYIEMLDCKNEPDIIIWKKGHIPYMVVELKNYDVKGYMIEPTFKRIIKNLMKYECYRLLVVSSNNNLIVRKRHKYKDKTYHYTYSDISHTRELLSKYNINIMVLDRQDGVTELPYTVITEDGKEELVDSKKLKLVNEQIEGWKE